MTLPNTESGSSSSSVDLRLRVAGAGGTGYKSYFAIEFTVDGETRKEVVGDDGYSSGAPIDLVFDQGDPGNTYYDWLPDSEIWTVLSSPQ